MFYAPSFKEFFLFHVIAVYRVVEFWDLYKLKHIPAMIRVPISKRRISKFIKYSLLYLPYMKFQNTK